MICQLLDETYPPLEARAKAECVVIYWGEDAGLSSDDAFGRGLAPAGEAPVASVPAKRVRAEVISAVSNQGLIRFIQSLNKDSEWNVILILGNVRVLQANNVRPWVARHSDQLEVFYLPPYAPKLNPDE